VRQWRDAEIGQPFVRRIHHVNLAVQLGAARILLLGYDMRAVDGKTHWFGEHPWPTRESAIAP